MENYKYMIGPWFPMVGANHKDWRDHMVDGLQIWHRDIEPWKNIIF
jgi:hypothetical protein